MRRFLFIVSLGVLSFAPFYAMAQSVNQAVANRQAELQAKLNDIEIQIAEQQRILDRARGQRQTLRTQIETLNAQIRKTQLQIREINLTITQLNGDIGVRNKTLEELSARLAADRESLAQIIRHTRILNDYSIVDVAFGSESVSSFFRDLDSFVFIRRALAESFDRIKRTSVATEAEKDALNLRLTEQEKLRAVAQLAKQGVEAQESDKRRLLAQTRGIEANYQRLIAENRRTAAQIRSELFALRDSAAIPFGTALLYAQQAERATGTRAALILAVLKQETNLGRNLGTGSWRVDMHPTRDQPVFVYITQTLGLDPDRTPVSKRPSFGWGGAMGPAQFIPSTWVCYGGFVNINTNGCTRPSGSGQEFWQGPWQYNASKDRIRRLIDGSSPSNPWDAQTAIMAAAMLLADNGASAQTRAAERTAALRYFAGWTGANNRAFAFYGDAVMRFAAEFQNDINVLSGS